MSPQLQRITEAKTAEEVEALISKWNLATTLELDANRAAEWQRRADRLKARLAEVRHGR